MSCRKECMQKTACLMHPCCSKGFCQAGPGPRLAEYAIDMRAGYMACCMRVRHAMKNCAHMTTLAAATLGRMHPHFLRIAEIGDSQKVRRSALVHVMRRDNA